MAIIATGAAGVLVVTLTLQYLCAPLIRVARGGQKILTGNKRIGELA